MYVNSFDPGETPSNLASHPDPYKLFDTRTKFSQVLNATMKFTFPVPVKNSSYMDLGAAAPYDITFILT